MGILVSKPSGVYTTEVDLSQIITSESSARAAIVMVSKQGSTEPKYFTSGDAFITEYGNPDSAISFDHYAALDYFREGNELWAVRVAGEGARTSAVAMYWTQGGYVLVGVEGGLEDPDNVDWNKVLPAGYSNPIAVFYPSKGPGSYGDNLAIEITSNNVEAFAPGEVLAESSNEGKLPAGTYVYQVSKIGQGGTETLVSNPVKVVIASEDQTNSVVVSWEADPLAIGYRVYGRTTDGVGLLEELGGADTTFTDTGALEPDLDVKPVVDVASLRGATGPFVVNVYDLDYNTSTPVEQFECTFGAAMDASGLSTELTERINPFSSYIQVASNAVEYDLDELPYVNECAMTQMTGGDSGSAPTAYDVAAAWNKFVNKELYSINILINSGKANAIVQQAMIELAEGRGDCVAMLDVPSTAQKAQQAVDYRNLTLNANTSYAGLFCPDLLEADNINGKQLFVPPSGWAAALCARTDRVANPSYSIAGLNRGLLNVLRTRETYDEGMAKLMFAAQVNYTRTFIGAGIALWEQRTLLAKESALSRISVRRIVNVIKKSLYDYLIYDVQEPNTEILANKIESSCSTYLETLVNAQALRGYAIDTTTSAVELDAGIRNVNIILIPVLPAEKIELKIGIGKSSVSIEELLTQLQAS